MTTYHEYDLDTRDFKAMEAPLNIYCARSKCNIIMPKGTPVRYYDGATMTHVSCPEELNLRNFAAHKAPESRFFFGDADA